jgi:tRNA-2-methylthio-N6-dimethylallyladenosine synthase
MNKKVFLRTFGCQMNERDSEIIMSMMMQEGYAPVESYEDADLIIFNTCSVRKHAEDRVWGKLEEMKRLKIESNCKLPTYVILTPSVSEVEESKYLDSSAWFGLAHHRSPGNDNIYKKKHSLILPIIGLVGCMGKAYGKEIFKRLPHVDFVCGPSNIYDIPSLVDRVISGERYITAIKKTKRTVKVITKTGTVPKKQGQPLFLHSPGAIRAFVNITQGCNNFCSYCIVPFVRGREISRPQKDIIDEIKQLVDNGTKEVTLLGQNVNSYKMAYSKKNLNARRYTLNAKTNDFVYLLEEVNKIKGLERIRFMTSHPKDAGIELFKAIAGLDKVCEHLHLPMQSGSDRILKLMNRGYASARYLKLIDGIRKAVPDCAITTDIIVGFPSESERDFKDTYEMMQKIKFDSAFIFKYSPRPFEKASQMNDDVSMEAKKERNQVLLNLQNNISVKKCERFIGKTENALGLSLAKRRPDSSSDLSAVYIKTRTRKNYQLVCKGSKQLIGKVFDVKIRDAQSNTLIGDIV